MNHTTETLNQLRQSLDEEVEQSILTTLKKHHKYLFDSIKAFNDLDSSSESKQNILSFFLHIMVMHARSEEETFYYLLKDSVNKEIRLESLKGQDEHDIAYEIAAELREIKFESIWSDEADAKARVLMGLIKGHLKEEEQSLFPMAEKYISESQLISVTNDYLEKFRIYLDIELKDLPSEVSRNDVMTFFY